MPFAGLVSTVCVIFPGKMRRGGVEGRHKDLLGIHDNHFSAQARYWLSTTRVWAAVLAPNLAFQTIFPKTRFCCLFCQLVARSCFIRDFFPSLHLGIEEKYSSSAVVLHKQVSWHLGRTKHFM